MRGGTALVASVAVTALAVGGVLVARTGGSGSDDVPAGSPSATATATDGPTTLASYDTRGVGVARAPFCDRVSPTGIEHAIGEAPAAHETWDNGDRVRLPDGGRDRVQEYGCAWTAPDGSRAAAWVFAPPVDRRTARALTRSRPAEDCTTYDGDRLGGPSVAWECDTGRGTEQRYAGRLGDAWLTCSVTTSETQDGTDERVSEWCVTVVEAARD